MKNIKIPTSELKNLKIEFVNNEYAVTLVDKQDFEIVKGYGSSVVKALNDLHHNLI